MANTSGVITIAKGIEIQARHLAEWKLVLKPEIYAELESWATATNVQAETGLDIRRGQSLDTFIQRKNEVDSAVGNRIGCYSCLSQVAQDSPQTTIRTNY